MDIRQLHYFLVLCEEMNYTRAAQRLFLSRQALRQCITALEAELCGPLFVSAHHKLSLTDRGVSLQRHAAPVVEQFQQMQAPSMRRSSLPSPSASASACPSCRTTCPGWKHSWTNSASSTPTLQCGSAFWPTIPWPMAWSRESWTPVW